MTKRIRWNLGHKACRDDRSVLYQRVPRLFDTLGLARGDGRHARLPKAFARVDVLILDDFGLSPLTAEQRRDLLKIVEDRYGRKATIVTSQLPVEHWHEIVGDPQPPDPQRAPALPGRPEPTQRRRQMPKT